MVEEEELGGGLIRDWSGFILFTLSLLSIFEMNDGWMNG